MQVPLSTSGGVMTERFADEQVTAKLIGNQRVLTIAISISVAVAVAISIINLYDDPATILKKFKRAVTDSEVEVRFDRAEKPGVSNLLEIQAAATGRSPDEIATGYSQYGPLKTDTGEAVVELLRPIQTRYHELLDDRAELAALLTKGADKARAVASKTLARAYDAIGLLPAG